MKHLKTFESYSYNFNDETIDEGWKNWALALGIALSALGPNHANASTSGIGDGIKDKITSVVNHGTALTIKNLEKDGYSPAPGTPIKGDKELVDSGFESTGQTKSAAETSIRSELNSKGIDTSNKSGFFVYKQVGQNISIKWISYK